MVAWERSRGCCTPSATVDAETIRLCLPAAVLAVSMALACKQTSWVWKMLSGRCTEEAACDRSSVPSGRAGGSGFVFKQDPIDVFRFASKKGYVFERGKCKGVSEGSLYLLIVWESPRKFPKSVFADVKNSSNWENW